MRMPYKMILLIPICVLLQTCCNYLIEAVYNYGISTLDTLLLIAALVLVLLITLTLYATFIHFFCRRDYQLLKYSAGLTLMCGCYYIFFIYGFSYLSIIQLLFVIIYTGGLKRVLSNDIIYQLKVANQKASEERLMQMENAIKRKQLKKEKIH